jgi:hypothetical protein
MISFATRDEADAAVKPGEQVCACLLDDGSPRYFTIHQDADDLEVQHAAFQVRNGRPMSGAEKVLAVLRAEN